MKQTQALITLGALCATLFLTVASASGLITQTQTWQAFLFIWLGTIATLVFLGGQDVW